jgi:hypothetical protein
MDQQTRERVHAQQFLDAKEKGYAMIADKFAGL